VTVLEAIQKSGEFLEKRGVDSPRLQAELLLAQVLKLPRMKLYLNFERSLAEPEVNALREFVKRRGTREPLQHILGTTSFCGLEIAVNRHVLVPRPETELLAELGWKFLSTCPQPATALDFGTGSGCIAIALATKCPLARFTALDISPEALQMAQQNAQQNAVADRIEFLRGDGFSALNGQAPFDLIVSNPPYIPAAEIATLQPEVKDFDPHTALDGGMDGLDFYRQLSMGARTFLKQNGRLMVEFGDGQAAELKNIFEAQMWIVESVREDYSHRQRILTARPG
jgi:release factor glutamine methyltransferase